MNSITEPLFDNCTHLAECDICGTLLGYWVTKQNANRVVNKHQKKKECDSILKGKVEF